jgi:hypothetical protein
MKVYWRNRGTAQRILDLYTRRRWVVSFTPRPLYHQGKRPWYPLDRRLGGPQSRSGRGGEEKNSQPLPGLEPSIIQSVAQCYTIELSRLLNEYTYISKPRQVERIVDPSFTPLSLRPVISDDTTNHLPISNDQKKHNSYIQFPVHLATQCDLVRRSAALLVACEIKRGKGHWYRKNALPSLAYIHLLRKCLLLSWNRKVHKPPH